MSGSDNLFSSIFSCMNQTQLTRKELYDLVWSKPLIQLAKIYNISDNGLRKICKKYEIPLPKMGHWQKIQFGKKVTIEKLVPKVKWEKNKIVLADREFKEKEKDHLLSRFARRTKEIKIKHPELIKVSSRLAKPDPLVVEARSDLKSKKSTSWRGYKSVIRSSSGILTIEVTQENVPRALRFMDAFIKLAKDRGHQITVHENDTAIIVDNERYKIRFREMHTRKVFEEGKWPYSDLVPNGKLSLKLDALYYKAWKDGKLLLEEQLPKIMAAFEIRAEDDKIKRAEIEAWRIKCEKERKIKEREEAVIKWEQDKGNILFKHSAKWNESQELKSFIEMIEKKFGGQQSKKLVDWINWAKAYQKELDPLSNGVESFLNDYDFPESETL